jgi:hypothetical protein
MAPKKPLSLDAIVEAPQHVSHRKLPAELIAQLLERLQGVEGFGSAFVREAMRQAPPGQLEAHWTRTSEALSKAGRQYSLGDAAFRETLALLQNPWLLAACQAGAVAGSSPIVVAAALARDGSEASHDALMAEFERARREASSEWELRYKLKRIARYATRNVQWKALEAAVHGELDAREAAAAADERTAARILGLEVKLLAFSASLFWHLRQARVDPDRRRQQAVRPRLRAA